MKTDGKRSRRRASMLLAGCAVFVLSLAAFTMWLKSRGRFQFWAFNPTGVVIGHVDGSLWLVREGWNSANKTAHGYGRMADREIKEYGETVRADFEWEWRSPPTDEFRLFIAVPLWVIATSGVLLSACLFAFGGYGRRQATTECGCGYDLTGNVSGTCPECGVKK